MKIKKERDNNKIVKFLQDNFSSPTHWPEWNILVSKYFNTNFYYFGLFEKGEIIGICPIHETKSGLIINLNSGQYHFIPNGGWILNKEKRINISNIPMPLNARFECFALPAIKEFGAIYSKVKKLFYTLIVDLKRTENEIWLDSINSKRRNMIRKAMKMEVKFSKGTGILNDFYRLYSDSNKILGFTGLTYDFFKKLTIESTHFNFVPFVAYLNEKPYSALGLIHDKNYSYYWLGSTNHNAENLGQGDLLQWEAIKYSKSQGCKYYDLCYIEKERLPHIYQFKKGFSKTEVEISYLLKKTILFRLLNKLRI